MSTTTVSRAATAGLVGGTLWALFPVASGVVNLEEVEFGTLSFVAVAASYWIFGVLPPALIVAGLVALRRALGADAGRVGTVGLILSMVGTGSMALSYLLVLRFVLFVPITLVGLLVLVARYGGWSRLRAALRVQTSSA